MAQKKVEIKPVLSIIILNYNTKELIKKCLFSLKNDRRLDFSLEPSLAEEKIPTEIIVVDNNSTDDSVEFIKSLTSSPVKELKREKKKTKNLLITHSLINNKEMSIRLIESSRNLGFAGGNNLGIKAARGEYLLLLNSDTVIPEGAISQTLFWLSAHPEVGVVSCKLINPDGTTQATGGFFPNLINLFCWAVFLDDIPGINFLIMPFHPHTEKFSPFKFCRERWYQQVRELDWVTGAFFLTRRAVVREIGLLNEDFFMYVEEMEWCYRAKKKGWKVYFYPGAKIIHLGGGSGTSQTAVLGEDRGLIKFFSLYRPSWQLPLLKMILKIKNITRWLFFGIIKGDEEKRKVFWQAFRAI